jgi:hypothetical protein
MNDAGESANSAPASATTPVSNFGALAHRYSFSETGGTTVADSVGGPLGPDRVLSSDSPTLRCSATTTNLTLTWPLECAGFTVQSRTNLVLGSWADVTSPAPQIVGDQWRLTIPAGSADATFFRLIK